MHDEDLEAAIAAYRAELDAGASLGTVELDEVEDHLRALIDELRAAGRSANLAFTEAVCRLGEPAAIAREYARVKPAFGARLSRARAWSAVALIVPFLVMGAIDLGRGAYLSFPWMAVAFQWLLSATVTIGLVARCSWARAIALGDAALVAINAGFWAWYAPGVYHPLYLLPGALAIVAFLAPWRRGELTAAGWALVLCAFSFVGVLSVTVNDAAMVAAGAYLLGAAGVLLRARWGSAALVVAAVAMLAVVRGNAEAGTHVVFVFYLVVQAVTAVALVAAAALSWRTARGGVGTLRALAA